MIFFDWEIAVTDTAVVIYIYMRLGAFSCKKEHTGSELQTLCALFNNRFLAQSCSLGERFF